MRRPEVLQRDKNDCSTTGVFRCTFRGGGYRKAGLHGFRICTPMIPGKSTHFFIL